MSGRSIALLAAALIAGDKSAVADDSGNSRSVAGGRFQLGALGGMHFFAADHGLGRFVGDPTDISPAHGFAFGGRVTWAMLPRLAIEAEFLASPTDTRNGATSMWVLGYRLNLLFDVLSQGAFRPFLLLGGGGLSSLVAHQNVVANDTDGALHAGAGARFYLADTWGLRIDARVLVPPAILSGLVAVGDETKFGGPDYEVLASVFLALGQPITSRPAPWPPVDPDPDRDGVLEGDDKCPLIAEDKDGFQDDDGCPELDNDGDGILDTKDDCPNQPETVNSYQDDDGCPDEVPAPVRKFIGVVPDIDFAYDQATLLPSSFNILYQALTTMIDFPDTRWQIAGYADHPGPPDYSRQLSQRRAQAVVDYLVRNGISAGRLKAVAHEQEPPVTDHATLGGHAKHRRTEFKLMSEPAK